MVDLAQRARGIDDRPVETAHEIKSVSREVTFAKDVLDPKMLERTLRELAGDVGRSLRKEGLSGTTIKLKLRWSDFITLTRQVSLPQPLTWMRSSMLPPAISLIKRGIPGEVRLIGIGVSGFGRVVQQLSFGTIRLEKQRQKSTQPNRRWMSCKKYGRKILKRWYRLTRRCHACHHPILSDESRPA
jgi:DNA polymerase-4